MMCRKTLTFGVGSVVSVVIMLSKKMEFFLDRYFSDKGIQFSLQQVVHSIFPTARQLPPLSSFLPLSPFKDKRL